MKNSYRFALVGLALLTTACLQTREELAEQDQQRQLREQVGSIQRSKADNEARYEDLQNDLRVVSGRLESMEHNQQQGHVASRQELDTLKKSVDAQAAEMKLIEQHMDAVEAKLTAAIQAVAAAPVSAAPAPAEKASAPTGKKGDPTLFAEGEALFAKKEFKKALVKYQSYRDKNPKGAKMPEAGYKVGICLAELGLKKEAKEIYQETVENYPNSPSAKKAKFRLSQLK